MFLPVVLDFENNGLKFMLLKYLRFFDMCKQKNWAIISHEEFKNYEFNFPERNEYKKPMQKLYGYKLYTREERQSVQQYYIPGDFFHELEEKKGSKLEAALYLLNNRDDKLEGFLKEFLDQILASGENVEGILYFAACPLSLKVVAEEYGIPMVAYETGPIREPNYRTTTSYFCRNGLYDVEEISERYQNYKKEEDELPTFSREEIIAMMVNQKDLKYLELIDQKPSYEIGIAGGCAIVVPYFAINKYTDHELIDDVLEEYPPNEIVVRLHPGDMYKATYRLPFYDASKSPFSFLVNVKRVAAVGSNMLFEAMLWKRIACSKTNVMPATIFCNGNYACAKEKKDTESFVNFFMFSFLVPSELAYDEEYLRWRLGKPEEKEIYMRHLYFYLEKFHLTEEWLSMEREARLNILKWYRGIDRINKEDVEFISLVKPIVVDKQINISELLAEKTKKNEPKLPKQTTVEDNTNYQEMEQLYKQTKDHLDAVLNSTSWKITAPIRKVLDIIKGAENG